MLLAMGRVEPRRLLAVGGDDRDLVGVVASEMRIDEDENVGDGLGEREGVLE